MWYRLRWRLAALFLTAFLPLFSPREGYGMSENEVLALALEDLRRVGQLGGPEALIATRYIWITDGDVETLQAVAYVMNSVSRATRPVPIDLRAGLVPLMVDKRVALVRVDLRNFYPQVDDLNAVVKTWEEFRFDPRFNLNLTKDTIEFAVGKGRLKDVTLKELTDKIEGDVVRVTGEHVDFELLSQVINLTRSRAPVVNHGYFIKRATTAVKDDGVFKTIYGGLYYELAGIKKGFKKGTDLDNFLDDLGIGNVDQGITAEKVFARTRSDQRIATFKSKVTGKTRAGDLLRQLTGRIGDTQGIVSITHDVKNKNFDIGRNFMLNLIPGTVKDDAREVIFEKANGFHGFALFNGDGELQEQVPPDVAADHLIPVPYGTILEPSIGCIRCHGKQRGWNRFDNDVKKLLSRRKLDIFGDQSQVKQLRSDTVDRLAGLYEGDAEFKLFPRGRDDYAGAVLKATGPWKKSKDQLDVIEQASSKVAAEYARYYYTPVSAATVLEDLGEKPQKGKEQSQLELLMLLPLNIQVDGIFPEDGRIGALIEGVEINRSDYDLVFSFMARRAQVTRELLKKVKPIPIPMEKKQP